MRRLRAAGAVILGKTNLSELASFPDSRRSTAGAPEADSQGLPICSTSIPAGPARVPGRAGGELCAAAVGTETDGSGSARRQQPGGGPEAVDGNAVAGRHHPDRPQPGHRRPIARTVTDAAIPSA